MLIAFALGVWERSRTAGLESVPGMVVQLIDHKSDGRRKAPVVEYTVEGVTYKIVSPAYLNPPAYAIGDEVIVYVAEDRPAEGRLILFGLRWIIPGILIFVGVPFIAAGGYFTYTESRLNSRRSVR